MYVYTPSPIWLFSPVGAFYYTLMNIHPVFHSCLQAIHLIPVAKTSDIHHCGFDALIQPFIKQVNVLGTVNSLNCTIRICMSTCVPYRMKVTPYSWKVNRLCLMERLLPSVVTPLQVVMWVGSKKVLGFHWESVEDVWPLSLSDVSSKVSLAY